jgi:O-antigen ligase
MTRRHRSISILEWLTVLHVGVYAIATAWAFGGQAEWVRGPLVAWGSIGSVITIAAVLESAERRRENRIVLVWAVPVLLFNGLVLLAALNPSLREITVGGNTILGVIGARSGWPSSARPELARTALWEFDSIWISCLNLALVIRRRRAIRILLITLSANAVVLAIFGTIQKLVHAGGLYFGTVPAPHEYFFSTFVYHNHWGAYVILMIAVTLGLCGHFARRRIGRDAFHSPAMLLIVTLLIVVATVPLSGSRSSTVLSILLLGGTFLHWTAGLVRKRRQLNESAVPPLSLALLAVAFGVAAIWYLGRQMIARRLDLTVEQIAAVETSRDPDTRVRLYRDTWAMAKDKPWFGWGMASYPYVFMMYNTHPSHPKFPTFFHDAHNDWLQAIAEHGFIGGSLLAAAAILPLVGRLRRFAQTPLAAYPLIGCGTILVYALLEFPFGNFAVVLTWWLCFFAAIQYSRLSTVGSEPRLSPASAVPS